MVLVTEEEHVMQIVIDERSRRGRRRRRSIGSSQHRGRESQAFSKADVECFKCHKLGHFKY